MAKTDRQVADQVAKLLRTAAPSSGASDNERSIAALEAARLIAERNLSVGEPERRSSFFGNTRTRERRQEPAVRPTPPIWSQWDAVDLRYDARCERCGTSLYTGERVLFNGIQYRCYDICD